MSYICLIKLINLIIMSETNSKANHSRFDRHAIFDGDDLRLVTGLITENIGKDFDLTNKLYGLFDGYLYNDLLELAKENLTEEHTERLTALVVKIKAN